MSGFNTPSSEQVREALRRIPTPQLRRAFYEGLKNPLWLDLLHQEGAFSDPPPRVMMPDGSTGDPYWPEIEYVVRVAGEAPAAAVDIFLALKESENAWVRRALFAAGATMPASEAARLKPVLQSWLTTGFGWRTDPRAMVDYAVNLIAGGERKTGEWVANVLFRPSAPEGASTPELVLEDYWYETGLPRIVEALGPEGFKYILGWLVAYKTAGGRSETWSFTRPRIGERRREPHGDVEDALIDATRDLAVLRMKTDPRGTAFLLSRMNLVLTRRIALYAAAKALADGGAEAAPELLLASTELLFDAWSDDEQVRVEFGALAREVALRDPSALDPLADFISAMSSKNAAELSEQLSSDEDALPADVEARVVEYAERREHLWLASVGIDVLPEQLARRLGDLDERLGVIEDPNQLPFTTMSWSGPNSPVSQDEMASMSPTELIAHLESWHDTGDGWGPEPSHEGQGRELQYFIGARPEALSGISNLVARLRPTYLRALLRAWATAFGANLALDWDQVADTVRDVLRHRDELDFPREGGDMDDDPDFTWAKRAAFSLLTTLVRKTVPARVPAAVLEPLADTLLESASSEAVWIDYSGGDHTGETDPLTLSLSWQWPIAIRGVATLVEYGPDASWSERARSTFLTELERSDPAGASRAVIGESFGRLLNADDGWTSAHVADWFGGIDGIDRGQQIALTTAISVHHYHRTLYELFSPALLAAMSLQDSIADGWQRHNSSPIQRIGEWAVKALIFGHADWSDPVVTMFFTEVDASERGAALGHVAWELGNATTVDSDIVERFAAVWDSRIAHVESFPADAEEVREFHSVVRSDKYGSHWWLPRLKRALELNPELSKERFSISSSMTSATDADPRVAFEVLELLLDTPDLQGAATWDMSGHAVPLVLARALESGDEQLVRKATAFMNALGEAGYLNLARQVREIRDRTTPPVGVDAPPPERSE